MQKKNNNGFGEQQFLFLLIQFCLLSVGQKSVPQMHILNLALLSYTPFHFGFILSVPSVGISYRRAEDRRSIISDILVNEQSIIDIL